MKWIRIAMVAIIILAVAVLGIAKNTWDEKIGEHAQKPRQLEEVSESAEVSPVVQETETSGTSEFYDLLLAKEISRIKLVGDGITAGFGHSAYSSPDGGRIVFSNSGQTFREPGFEFDSWANQLRQYVSAPEFGEIDLVNAGIIDKTADWALRNIDFLLAEQEDVVFIMIGTDDRIYSTIDKYESDMRQLLAIADERSEHLVVMSPPPSKEDIFPYNFTMEQVDEVLKKISEEESYTFISHYDAMQQHLADNESLVYEDLMQTAGANPVDGGYALMWETMRVELGL